MDKDATQESTDAATASDGERTRQTDAESQSEQSTAKISTKAGLWWPRATLQSLFDANVDFYPRLNTRRHRFPTNIKVGVQNLLQHQQLPIGIRDWAKGWKLPEPDKIVIASVKSDIILEQMGSVMQGWTGPIIAGDVAAADAAKAVLDKIVAQEHLSEDEYKRIHAEAKAALEKMSAPEMSLDDAIELAKASLDEVKAQTEYQDQKAMRLLTVTTFLSALSGALFVNFSANYPLRMADSLSAGWPARSARGLCHLFAVCDCGCRRCASYLSCDAHALQIFEVGYRQAPSRSDSFLSFFSGDDRCISEWVGKFICGNK